MTADTPARVLAIVCCAAGPASEVGTLARLVAEDGWAVQVIATPDALAFLDVPALERQTGTAVRSAYRRPGEPRSSKSDAIIVAPASYNTINKWAAGISDTYALGILAEAVTLPIPIVVVPFVNTALASRTPFRRAVASLRAEGVYILLGTGQFEPHPPGTGGDRIASFPWQLALDTAARLLAAPQAAP